MRHEQDKVAGAQVKLAGAVILQAVEARVVAVAPAELEGAAAKHEKAECIGILDALELRRAATYLLPSGMGVAESASSTGDVSTDGTLSQTLP